ncbi:MAG TPA: ABC transporter permease [Terracidiphilus sp.]|nr:ABC transporter permease [Terracidiphilus sp.]
MRSLGQNLRFALRQLARNPGFTVTVVITLALSIGANTAIFSVVNALMLKSLPYPQPDRIGTLFQHEQGPYASDDLRWIDGTQWEHLRDNVPSLISAVSSALAAGANLEADHRIDYVHDGRVSAHYFDVLGIRPALGRTFSEEEDRPSGPKAAILSYNLWRNTFGADPNLVGQVIHLKGEPYAVIGILPQGQVTPLNADLYTSLQPSPTGEGNGTNYEAIFRLRDGATWQQADAEMNRAWAYRISQIESKNPGTKILYYTVPLQRGMTAALRPRAVALMLSAGFILLIACGNLAGLTLVRMSRRLPEIATRLALGASRWQIQKQLWLENLLLACLGGAAGIGVGFAALRGLLSLLPKGFLPIASVPLDGPVLAFTMAVSLLTSVLFGMLPAFATSRIDLRSSLANRISSSVQSLRIRQILIAGEVALTVMLLAGSGLLIRSLIHLQTLPPGFNPNGVMTAKASLDDARYHDPVAFRRLMSDSISAMQRIPGVQSAAVGLTLPYERTLNDGVVLHDGPQTGKSVGTDAVYITPRFFDVLQMPIIRGRAFTTADLPNTQPVVIINSTFAQKFFPGLNPVGFVIGKNALIVGVVSDTQLSSGLNATAPIQSEETIYVPATQVAAPMLGVHVWFQPSWVVRTAGPVEGLTGQMQKALANVDPALPFSGFYRMSDLQAEALSEQRVEVALLGTMAGLALLLSAVGIFALVASLVTQRTREIGIRIALGSTIRQAITHVSSSGVRAAGVGLVLGLVLCFLVLRTMRSVLYGVGVFDAPSLFAVVVTLAAVTLMAATIPALRIARIDPATTLREE